MMTLNLQRVNACSPYVLQESSRPLLYEFITDYGIDYTIGFALSDLLPGVECYEFVIINSNNRKSLRDYKLRETVYALIYEFFSQATGSRKCANACSRLGSILPTANTHLII